MSAFTPAFPGWQHKLTDIYAVDDGEGYEQREECVTSVDAVEREDYRRYNGHGVLATVDKMRKHVSRILITPKTLQKSPDWRKGHEEAQESRVIGVALIRVVPVLCV